MTISILIKTSQVKTYRSKISISPGIPNPPDESCEKQYGFFRLIAVTSPAGRRDKSVLLWTRWCQNTSSAWTWQKDSQGSGAQIPIAAMSILPIRVYFKYDRELLTRFHPHLHAIVADGLLRKSSRPRFPSAR